MEGIDIAHGTHLEASSHQWPIVVGRWFWHATWRPPWSTFDKPRPHHRTPGSHKSVS